MMSPTNHNNVPYDVGQSIAHAVPLPMPGGGGPGEYQDDVMEID